MSAPESGPRSELRRSSLHEDYNQFMHGDI